MARSDDTTPATKADFQQFVDRMTDILSGQNETLISLSQQVDGNSQKLTSLASLIRENSEKLVQHDSQFELLLKHISDKAEEVMRHFDVVAEDLKHDHEGIFKCRLEQQTDKQQQLDERLIRVEEHLQLIG